MKDYKEEITVLCMMLLLVIATVLGLHLDHKEKVSKIAPLEGKTMTIIIEGTTDTIRLENGTVQFK